MTSYRHRILVTGSSGQIGTNLALRLIDDCVDGLCRGIRLLLSSNGANRTLNLARGEGHGLMELAELIGEALDRSPVVRSLPALRGEVTYYTADITEARETLGYDPRTSLREGVSRAIAWWRMWKNSPGTSEPAVQRNGHVPAVTTWISFPAFGQGAS